MAKPTPPQTRDVSALEMRAAVGTVNEEKRTVEVMFSTGAPVLRYSYYDGPSYETLSMDPKHIRLARLAGGAAPLLGDHRASIGNVIGVVESARIENGKGIATVRFAKAEDDPEADKVFRKVKDGIIKSVSVGYRTYKTEKVSVEGDAKIPTFRATDWEPYEISAVALPAEAGAGFRSADPQQCNPCVFVTRQEQNVTEEEKQAAAEAAKKAELEARAAELKAENDRVVKLERERVSGITHAVRVAKLDPAFGEKLVADGVEIGKARALVLDELAKRSDEIVTNARGGVEVGEGHREKMARGLAAALIFRAGVQALDQVKRIDPKFDTDPGELRTMSLMDVVRECVELSGKSTRHMSREQMVSFAFTHRSSGMSSTSDFAVLFESVLHKMLLGAYKTTPDTWSRICKQTTVRDFRDANRYRNGTFGVLDSLSEHGEFVNKAIPDGAKTTIAIGTKGNMIALTRQAIINDDMGAFSDLTQRFGRMAALTIESDFYTQLLLNSGLGPDQDDGQPFFHANRANVNATGSALGVAGIDADRVKMAAQMDQDDNEFLDLRPSILLVASGLGAAAKVLNASSYDHTTTDAQKPNAVQGLFSDIIDTPRLTGTRRYLFAPKEFGTVEVAFLEGVGNSPVLEQQDGWRVDGTEWKLRLDYVLKFMDGKGAVTNAGT